MTLVSGMTPSNEGERLRALRGYHLVGSLRDKMLDEVALITARLFGVPVALVWLVTAGEAHFQPGAGPAGCARLPRTDHLCSAAVLHDHLAIFENGARHPCELASQPVADQFQLGFYASQPLVTSAGHAIGALCILDHEPRELGATPQAVLANLAQVVMVCIGLRASAAEAALVQPFWEQLEEVMRKPLRQLLIAANQLRRTLPDEEAQAAHWQQVHALLQSIIRQLT
ncbi:hypothetical protein GCM10027048_34300 [Hymenobacter coalescens]